MTNTSIILILICEQDARLRKIDLVVAQADAAHWWGTGSVPLLPNTPEPALRLDMRWFYTARVEEAMANVRNDIPQATLYDILLTRYPRKETRRNRRNTPAEATENVKQYIPPEAVGITMSVSSVAPKGVLSVEAETEQEATREFKQKTTYDSMKYQSECEILPQKGS